MCPNPIVFVPDVPPALLLISATKCSRAQRCITYVGSFLSYLILTINTNGLLIVWHCGLIGGPFLCPLLEANRPPAYALAWQRNVLMTNGPANNSKRFFPFSALGATEMQSFFPTLSKMEAFRKVRLNPTTWAFHYAPCFITVLQSLFEYHFSSLPASACLLVHAPS